MSHNQASKTSSSRLHQHLFLARMIAEARARDPRTQFKLEKIEGNLQKYQHSIYEPPVLSCIEDLDWFLRWLRRPAKIRKPDSTELQIERVGKRIRSVPPDRLLRKLRGRVKEPLLLAGKLRRRFAKDEHRPVSDVLKELRAGSDTLLVGHLNRFRNGILGLTVGAAVVWLEDESRRRALAVEPLTKTAAAMRNVKVAFKTIDTSVPTRLPPQIAKASRSEQAEYLRKLESRIVAAILAACIGALVQGRCEMTAYHCSKKVLKPLLQIFWPEHAESAPEAALKAHYNSTRNTTL